MDTVTYDVVYSKESDAIKALLTQRGVNALCHFTTFENLCSMVEMGGLVSRATLGKYGVQVDIQDPMRLEGGHFINLSIQRPNLYLWSKFAERYPQKEWCLLMLNPENCQRDGVKFTTANATAYRVRSLGTNAGVIGLKALFADRVVDTIGEALRTPGLPSNYPTSIQAEVLCPEPIAWADVYKVVVFSDVAKRRLVEMSGIAETMVEVSPNYFPEIIQARASVLCVTA